MITTIFSKSKPINFLIVFSITLIAFLLLPFKYPDSVNPNLTILANLGVFLLVFLSVLVLNFIVSKNLLSQQNNYEILLFALFLLAVPQAFLNYKIVISNFFILLALRRLISVRSKKEVVKKLFDSGFLIGISALFYFWSILFFPLIFIALLLFSETTVKYYLVPFVGLAAIAVIAICFSIVIYNDYFLAIPMDPAVNFNFNNYNSLQFITAITMMASFGIWSSLFYLRDIKKKMRSYRPSYKILFLTCVFAAVIVVFAPIKNGSEFLFLFAPLSVIVTNYIETIEDKWFKELFLGLLIIIPITLLVL
ncbi:DUF6427 family protein [Olleya sp. HaHaR_3_96]|uniref:DUF6427 family protein n=1 Tax=Olleya sp. HaHaR_3_96 TaxID=2745560 RepID=UPI001C4E56EF|nr:DUF6427 family protein [Olleya sp. HaHaR_3_96]QXP60686.1 hypothetical protein H0I26_03335 [Olleya sp. HaHaR_3_96]